MVQFSVVEDRTDDCVVGAVVDDKAQRDVLARQQGHDDSDIDTEASKPTLFPKTRQK